MVIGDGMLDEMIFKIEKLFDAKKICLSLNYRKHSYAKRSTEKRRRMYTRRNILNLEMSSKNLFVVTGYENVYVKIQSLNRLNTLAFS